MKQNKDINLLHAYEIGFKKRVSWADRTIIGLMVEIIVLFIITTFVIITVNSINNKNVKTQNKINSYSSYEKSMNSYKKMNKLYNDKAKVYDEILKDNEKILDTINTIENVMPKEMTIESMSVKQNSVSFIVKYYKEDMLTEFINKLQETEKFSEITLDGVTSGENAKRTSINTEMVRK